MKRLVVALTALLLAGGCGLGTPVEDGLKVFISVDMEGIASATTSGDEMGRAGYDYDMFREIMTQEANAAIEGALAAGATEIVVRDAHGTARNILPQELRREAKLLRDWSDGPKGMMEGIDESFDAVAFVGYHAKANTPDALMQHTMSGAVADLSINNISLGEGGFNALIAGHYGVPVVFIAGDQAAVDEVQALIDGVEGVATKQGIGVRRSAALSLHPEVAQERIRAGVERALRNLNGNEPFELDPPFTLVLQLRTEERADRGEGYPGAERTGPREWTFTSYEIMDVIQAFQDLR